MVDYVIAGGGAAGCVLAARLSEGGASVLLLEAGYPDKHPFIHIPAGFTKLSGPRVNWGYRTVPQKHLNNRDMWYPQGKTLGGGSSINAMIYTRGHRTDYDRWAEGGATGWSYEEVLPYFRRAESNGRFSNRYHGTDGPLAVSDPISPLKITSAFIKAAQEAGIPYNPDFNGAEQEGVGYHQTTTRDGRRGSAAVSYLRPAKGRKNLTVITRAQVSRILVENGRAVGVEYRRDGSTALERAEASVEVIITAGAIGSPKLLMLSGIGQADHLRQHGIPVVHDSPGVGENLQDHLDCYTVYDCSGPHSYYGVDQHLRQAWWGMQYVLFRNGPVTTNIVEGGAFVKADPNSAIPDTQLHFLPAYVVDHGMMRIPGYGVCLYTNLLRPKSRGTVRLAGADPAAPPLIDPNYLSDPDDARMAIAGLRLARDVMAQPAMRPYLKAERMPGTDKTSDAELAAYVREWAKTDYHPVGTCKMGTDAMAVVDPELRVNGIERLRVCNSSVMPLEISANTNAPTIMIAEKASDLILGQPATSLGTLHEAEPRRGLRGAAEAATMTDLYGIIGDPVAQVRSPAVFNARFQAAGLDAVMVPMHVSGDDFELALAGLRAIENLAGLVITVPHKPAAARLLRSCSDRVRLAGAANVLRPTPDGWDGDLFDGEGFAIGLEANGFRVAGKRCALVGAGGAGAAIAVALITREIAELTVFDIDQRKTSDLVTRLQRLGRCPVSVGRPCRATDLAINATPLGMEATDPLPFDVDCLRPEATVADAIMKPPVTRLLLEAARRGCRTQEGRHMLDNQIDAIWDFFGLSR